MSAQYRQRPPRVGQALSDSCWAAAIESWSSVDRRIPSQQEANLVSRYGEGATGGITPRAKIPVIARQLNLQWGGFAGRDFAEYVDNHLGSSHLFCAYSIGQYLHAVLIYGYDGRTVHVMDPRNATWANMSRARLESNAALVMMRR